MKKLPTKEAANLFANGFTKGREAGITHALKATTAAAMATVALERRLAYARRRIAYLARWRKFAIDRFGLGPETVKEVDIAAKKATR